MNSFCLDHCWIQEVETPPTPYFFYVSDLIICVAVSFGGMMHDRGRLSLLPRY